jgi:tetratricopeptide (TPR) repeat protein
MDGSRQPFSWPVSPATIASQTAEFEHALARIETTADPDDLRVLEARRQLGNAYAITGRTQAAIDVFESNLAAAEKVGGSDHPNAVIARADLAWAWRRDGRVAEALALHERCVTDLGRLLGTGSVPTAKVRLDLGRTLIAAHQRDLALLQLEQALTVLDAAGSSADPDVLAGRMALAGVYRSAGRVNDAVELAERTAAACGQRLRSDDPEAISCRAMLATIRGAAGNAPEAVAMLTQARSDFEKVLGPDHVETIRTGLFIADNLRGDRAVAEFERTLQVATRVLGRQHLLTITGRDNLAATYLAAGHTAEAISALEEVIRDTQPPYSGDTKYNSRRILLARALFKAGRTGDAILVAEEVIEECPVTGDPAARTAIEARIALAYFYEKSGQDSDADAIYRAVLPAMDRVYGPGHQTTKRIRRKLSHAPRAQSRY